MIYDSCVQAAHKAAQMEKEHYEYGSLATRILVSNLHKNTSDRLLDVAKALRANIDPETGHPAPVLAQPVYEYMQENEAVLQGAIKYEKDYNVTYFGQKTMERGYLQVANKKIQERKQHMLMRVAVGVLRPGHKLEPVPVWEKIDEKTAAWGKYYFVFTLKPLGFDSKFTGTQVRVNTLTLQCQCLTIIFFQRQSSGWSGRSDG